MFDIGWSELLVIGIVALIAIGPKELPGVLRTVGQWMGKIRRMASEFQGQFQEAMREAEMADLKKQVDDMTSAATNLTSFDPVDSVRKELDSVRDDIQGAIETKPADAAAAASPEAVAPATPGPVAPETTIPQSDAAAPPSPHQLGIAPVAPQPQTAAGEGLPPQPSDTAGRKAGGGA
jgi:sec-independent protein translocase protein TatB